MSKFTINEFRKKYATDAACLDKIFTLRYGKLQACPECASPASFRRITTRRCYQCKHCYAQFYPTAGTVFEKTRTPLSDWFYVIYLFTTTRNGVSAKEIERQLGVTYKCAFRMGHCVRKLIGGMDMEKLKGFVEMDEAYYGPKNTDSGRSLKKSVVFGMVERQGNVKALKMENVTKETVYPLIAQHVNKDAKVSTDEFGLYISLRKDLGIENHGVIRHGLNKYREGSISTNTIEGYWSHLKRMLHGTHIHVSGKYLQNYIDENSFRYNNRKNQHGMFEAIINHLPKRENE